MTYFRISSPSFCPTVVAGNICASATSSSPLAAVLVNTIPTPPASLTTDPFCTLAFTPLSQSTILPFTLSGNNVPGIHRAPLVELLALPA
ncbi:hypothetical protein HanHA300_Chr12g0452701 [Helianthus annuus]|nr:hypothetical protein HanHA300_Chr12g0452701 [Helianthus annuus]KAJ0506116.1 hypothetical protein HanHA89_Chr12g0478281 [Helianthus annuus]KAJ0675787.1 hypothetical protein HanLR1_Chr12g0455181 [Helianthus annuus]KAJ0679047.1 hypothetical protein HanOQP8_Chr12g0454871 [Helianthus annuus]